MQEYVNQIKHFVERVRYDKEALKEIRLLGMVLLCCFAVYYGADVLLIQPKAKLLRKQNTELSSLSSSSSDIEAMLTLTVKNLGNEKKQLMRRRELLKLKEKYFKMEWQLLSDEENFSRILLTTYRGVDINFSGNISMMRTMDEVKSDGYLIYPIEVGGTTDFHSLVRYLSYLEKRSEVGFLDSLTVAIEADNQRQQAGLQFRLEAGRIVPEALL